MFLPGEFVLGIPKKNKFNGLWQGYIIDLGLNREYLASLKCEPWNYEEAEDP
jgi:hypothetical protein